MTYLLSVKWEVFMLSVQTGLKFHFGIMITALFLSPAASAQVMGIGREHAEIKRLRPAEVYLANSTISVHVMAVDPRAVNLAERLKKIVINGALSANRTLREAARSPQILVDCSITKFDYGEKTEEEKVLLVKGKGTFKAINAVLEVSYKVVRTSGNFTYFADNVSSAFKKKYQVGVQASPSASEVEDTLMRSVINRILAKLTDQEETLKVRLMGKGDLDRYAKFAQAKQWNEYIESINALPERKPDKEGRSEFEADRNYSLAIAYEALAYENLRKDYNKAAQYFDLADTDIRKARQYDPRENEYVVAQSRMKQGMDYLKTFKERYPQQGSVAAAQGKQDGPRGITSLAAGGGKPAPSKAAPGAMTNDDVITMVKEGLSENLIISQIKSARVKQFDASTAGIIQLHKSQVSETVINVIIEVMQKQPSPRRRRN
jgi:hypothetical protein